MADNRSRSPRPLIVLGLFLIFWWLLPTVLKTAARVGFEEFQAPVWVASTALDDLGTFWAQRTMTRNELIEAGRDVARRKAYYQFQVQENADLRAEVERLAQLLDLTSPEGYRMEAARVIRRDVSGWWQRLTIRKGRRHGVPLGAAVVYEGGVVGRVVEVLSYTSVVELVSSPNFRIAATFEDELRPVLYQGMVTPPFSTPRGRVMDAPQDLRASEARPLRLVTSGLGGTFPRGITIGRVEWLELGRNGLFQDGQVRLDPDLHRLREVTVLIPEANPEL